MFNLGNVYNDMRETEVNLGRYSSEEIESMRQNAITWYSIPPHPTIAPHPTACHLNPSRPTPRYSALISLSHHRLTIHAILLPTQVPQVPRERHLGGGGRLFQQPRLDARAV